MRAVVVHHQMDVGHRRHGQNAIAGSRSVVRYCRARGAARSAPGDAEAALDSEARGARAREGDGLVLVSALKACGRAEVLPAKPTGMRVAISPERPLERLQLPGGSGYFILRLV